jgi:bacterioferritin-associated ferredoxin
LESFQIARLGVIVCSCNRISDAQILAARDSHPAGCPFSPGRAYKSLGCTMKCGRCVSTVRALLTQPHDEGCIVTGQACNAHSAATDDADTEWQPAYAIAAE